MKKDSKFFTAALNIDLAVAVVGLVILIVTTFLGVPMRYIVNKPFTWLEEVQSACLVWIVYGAASAGFRTGSHVAIEMIVERFSAKIQKVFQILISIVVIIVLGYLLFQSFGFIQMFLKNVRTTSILHIPYWAIYLICPISFALQIFSYIMVTVKGWSKLGEVQEMEVNN